MKISIIIVTYQRKELLVECLQSLKNQNDNLFICELIIVINGEEHFDQKIIKNIFSNSIIIPISICSPAKARNIAINYSNGEFLLFIDDDVVLPNDYLDKAKQIIIKNPRVDVFGGPDKVHPKASFFEKTISYTLQSPLATAHTRFRHKQELATSVKGNEGNLILCNLWIRKIIFTNENLSFDESYSRNEENILLEQIIRKNYDMLYLSKLFLYHRRRKKIVNFLYAVARSAFFRIRSFFEYPQYFSILYCIPLIALLIFFQIFLYFSHLIVFIVIIAFLIINFAFSIMTLSSYGEYKLIPAVSCLVPFVNLAYALGSLYSLFYQLLTKLRK